MNNLFDGLKAKAFSVVTNTMGYSALWFPGGDISAAGIPAKVLFNDHARKESIAEHDFDYDRPSVEFKHGDWNGLKQSVDSGENEVIEVRGIMYYVLKVDGTLPPAKDGENYIAILKPVE